MPRRWLDSNFFTDEKMINAPPLERYLALAIIACQDDDGRIRGDLAYLKAIAFPYDNLPLGRIKAMRDHLAEINPNIIVYRNGGADYIQLKQYRRYQRPRYYHPSRLPAPPGWPATEQTPPQQPDCNRNGNHVVTKTATKQLPHGDQPSNQKAPPDLDLDLNLEIDKGVGEGEGKGGSGGKPPPSQTASSTDENQILHTLVNSFKREWGKVPAREPEKIISREPTARESAQLRDLAKNLSAVGVPLDYIRQAFREAAAHQKHSISYVRAIMLDWLGVRRRSTNGQQK